MSLSGSRAIVTGAGQGIGKAIATELVGRGADLQIFEINPDTAAATAAELSDKFGDRRVTTFVGSVTDTADIARALDQAEADLGGTVDLLVNNAGYGELALIVDMSDEQWTKIVDLCLTAPFLVSREWAKRLIAAGLPGAAVNISSLNYTAATEGLSAYCSAKAGVAHFTKCCAAEWGRHGIRVNAVAPGATQTELTRVNGLLSGQMAEEFISRTPLGRFGETDDIARGVALLLSDDAGWVSGVTLSVDGGAHIKGLHSYWDVAQSDIAAAGGAS